MRWLTRECALPGLDKLRILDGLCPGSQGVALVLPDGTELARNRPHTIWLWYTFLAMQLAWTTCSLHTVKRRTSEKAYNERTGLVGTGTGALSPSALIRWRRGGGLFLVGDTTPGRLVDRVLRGVSPPSSSSISTSSSAAGTSGIGARSGDGSAGAGTVLFHVRPVS